MTPTAYGYKVPDTGDLSKGVLGWFSDLVFNWLRMSGHSHNGTDSVQLLLTAIATPTVVAPSGSWTVSGSGYSQLVTCPAPITEINNQVVKFLINTAGGRQYEELKLEYVRVTGTTFTLYCNDNTVDILCVFR